MPLEQACLANLAKAATHTVRIQIGPLATTREACEDDAMTLETTCPTDLQPAATLESSATDLRFRNAGGATQVLFLRR